MKKLFSILLCFILLLTPLSAIPTHAETMPQLILGDANCDGKVDAVDALKVLIITVTKCGPGNDPYDAYYFYAGRLLCNVDHDPKHITANDALLILQYAVGKRTSFPVTEEQIRAEWDGLSWPGDRS